MISCITPHVGEEIWQLMGHDNTIAYESWPTYDEAKCKDTEINIAVQVNGKMRGTVLMEADLDNDTVVQNVLADEKYIDEETGAFDLSKALPISYSHGGYYTQGEKIGGFGWTVKKKK